MLFFNLQTLEAQSCDNAIKFITLLKHHYDRRLPSKWLEIQPSKVSLYGRSFILNPDPLFNNKSVDIIYKVQYVKLAARRDYSFYKEYDYRGLKTSYYPDLNYDAIKTNPLLKITKSDILFKYEEK